MRKTKDIFEERYTSNWTTELFKIVKVKITNPTTYLLKDTRGAPITGAFYEEKLQKMANPDIYLIECVIKMKDNKLYVKIDAIV